MLHNHYGFQWFEKGFNMPTILYHQPQFNTIINMLRIKDSPLNTINKIH